MQNCKINAKILILVSQFVLIIGVIITLYAYVSNDGNHPDTVHNSKIAGPILIGIAFLMLAFGCGSRKRFQRRQDAAHIAAENVTYGGTHNPNYSNTPVATIHNGKELTTAAPPLDIHMNEDEAAAADKNVGTKRGGWERFP